jgi:hypothetical protein
LDQNAFCEYLFAASANGSKNSHIQYIVGPSRFITNVPDPCYKIEDGYGGIIFWDALTNFALEPPMTENKADVDTRRYFPVERAENGIVTSATMRQLNPSMVRRHQGTLLTGQRMNIVVLEPGNNNYQTDDTSDAVRYDLCSDMWQRPILLEHWADGLISTYDLYNRHQ